MAVKRSFSSAIVYSRRLSKGKVDLMVLFMVDNHCDLFKVSRPHGTADSCFVFLCFKKHNQFKTSWRQRGPSALCSRFLKQIPVSLHKLVSDRIMSIMKGNDPNLTTGWPTLPSSLPRYLRTCLS